MRTIAVLVPLLFSGLLLAGSSRASERLEIKGVGIGDRFSEIGWSGPSCAHLSEHESVQCYDQFATLGGKRATRIVEVADGKVDSVYYGSISAAFGDIAAGFASKYGKPRTYTSTVQDAMGATFSYRVVDWTDGTVTLRVVERAGAIDKMAVLLSATAPSKAAKEREKQKQEEVRSDL